MVVGMYIKGFRSLYWCCDRCELASSICTTHNPSYHDRSSVRNLPRRHLV
jgi:hypothetical protein